MAFTIPLGFVLIAALTRLAATSQITSVPNYVQGYQSLGHGSWGTITCGDPLSTYFTSSGYARCCTDGFNCNFVTSCSANTIYNGDGAILCPTGQSCAAMTIYESATTDKPAIDYFCYDTWSVSTIFRQTAAPTTTDTTSITAAPGSSTTTALAASATSTGTSSSSPSKDDSGGGASKAWIAGAVIGPVAGAVLVFGLGYWFARRRLRERHVPQPPSSSGNQDLYSPLPPSPAQNVHIAPLHEKDGNARPLQPSELPS